jgi:endonuclease YncB( thermonuclease family)
MNYDASSPWFTLSGMEADVRVIDIIDGDSLIFVMHFNGAFHKFRGRLAGIDTCELSSTNPTNKQLAHQAKKRLYQLVTRKDPPEGRLCMKKTLFQDKYMVRCKLGGFDKFGRVLVDLFAAGGLDSFSDILVREKLAYRYKGNKKMSEAQQRLLLTGNE